MGIAVIAQGVETAQQSALLKDTDAATHAQGFHFSKPVSAQKAGELLSRGSVGAAKPLKNVDKAKA